MPGSFGQSGWTAGKTGLANLPNPDGEDVFSGRYALLRALGAGGIRRSDFDEMQYFYSSAREMMYEPAVSAAFRFTTPDRNRYGNTPFGNSCLVARNLVSSNLGTRYIQITLGGWDHHQNIYANNGIYAPARQLDAGLSNLIADLAATAGEKGGTRLDETLIVVKGEFGRTVGELTDLDGRDHYFVHSALFAGGGVRGGQVLGATTEEGMFIDATGWAEDRPMTTEDIATTIYSSLGIDYAIIRRDDPLGRGFEYIPSTGVWSPYPIRELF